MEYSPEPGSKKKRPYAFACSNCRKKKIRCDGGQPECRSCVKAEEVCQYPKKRMEAQLVQAQKRIKELETELQKARTNSPYGSNATSSPGALYSDSDQDYSLYSQVGFDERGSITYHGPTSQFHGASLEEDFSANAPDEEEIIRERLREISQREFKTNHEYLHTAWEPSLTNKTEADFGIPPNVANHLLAAYFQWQNPFHNFVYRTSFMRDLALGGPYYSRFLLTCIFALASRHCNHEAAVYQDKGERFLVAAKEILVNEIGRSRPTIPTIQGLLVLGFRQCSIGNTSEGWLFSGMAFRMMTDIGLHLDTQKLSKYEQLSATDIETRKRLAYSAYTWDKILSLTLGRPPSLGRLTFSVEHIFDELDDRDYWAPLNCEDLSHFRPSRFYNTATFKQLCRLGDIVTFVLAAVSNAGRSRVIGGQIESVQNRLEFWYDQLPPVLRIDDAHKRETCPAPHILSLNLLYRTLLVTLFRPYTQMSSRSQSSIFTSGISFLAEQVARAHDLLLMYCRTFKYKGLTYLISYCVYTVATVDIFFLRTGDDAQRHGSALRLKMSLKLLEKEAKQAPEIQGSIDAIKKQIRNAAAEGNQARAIQGTEPKLSRHSSSPGDQLQYGASRAGYHKSADVGSTTSDMHGFPSFSQPQYVGGYSTFAGPQQPMGQTETSPWNMGASLNDPAPRYDPDAFGWHFEESVDASLSGNASMFGWPPSTSMP